MDSIAPLSGPNWGADSDSITGIIVQYIDEYHIYNLACMLLITPYASPDILSGPIITLR